MRTDISEWDERHSAEPMRLAPRDWGSFQHYKNRSPAWIKLHKLLLDDYDFQSLPIPSKALLPMLWLLASEFENGFIVASATKLAFRLRMTESEFLEALAPIIEHGFFAYARDVLAQGKQTSSPEKNREEQEEEEERDAREAAPQVRLGEDFWKAYPHPANRGDKVNTVKRINELPAVEQRKALESLEPFKAVIAKEQARNKDYLPPMAATYVNQRRWESVLETAAPGFAPVIMPTGDREREIAEKLIEAVTVPFYSAWFTKDGKTLFTVEDDKVVLRAPTPLYEEQWKHKLRSRINTVLGDNWKVEPERKAA